MSVDATAPVEQPFTAPDSKSKTAQTAVRARRQRRSGAERQSSGTSLRQRRQEAAQFLDNDEGTGTEFASGQAAGGDAPKYGRSTEPTDLARLRNAHRDGLMAIYGAALRQFLVPWGAHRPDYSDSLGRKPRRQSIRGITGIAKCSRQRLANLLGPGVQQLLRVEQIAILIRAFPVFVRKSPVHGFVYFVDCGRFVFP